MARPVSRILWDPALAGKVSGKLLDPGENAGAQRNDHLPTTLCINISQL